MFNSEVVPAQLGPMTETISPRVTSSVTFSTARTPPKRFDTAVAASCGAAAATVGPAEVFISIWGLPSRLCAAVMADMMRRPEPERNQQSGAPTRPKNGEDCRLLAARLPGRAQADISSRLR